MMEGPARGSSTLRWQDVARRGATRRARLAPSGVPAAHEPFRDASVGRKSGRAEPAANQRGGGERREEAGKNMYY